MYKVSWIDGATGNEVEAVTSTLNSARDLAMNMSNGGEASIETKSDVEYGYCKFIDGKQQNWEHTPIAHHIGGDLVLHFVTDTHGGTNSCRITRRDGTKLLELNATQTKALKKVLNEHVK